MHQMVVHSDRVLLNVSTPQLCWYGTVEGFPYHVRRKFVRKEPSTI